MVFQDAMIAGVRRPFAGRIIEMPRTTRSAKRRATVNRLVMHDRPYDARLYSFIPADLATASGDEPR